MKAIRCISCGKRRAWRYLPKDALCYHAHYECWACGGVFTECERPGWKKHMEAAEKKRLAARDG